LLVEAGGAMRLDVLAHRLGHAMVEADVAQVGDGHLEEEGEHPREGRKRVADEGEAQIVVVRPALVLRHQFHDGGRKVFAGEDLEQMAFGQVRVVEGGANQFRVGADQEARGEASGAAPGQGDFFPARHAVEPLEDSLFGDHLDVSGDAGGLRDPHEVEEVKELQDRQGDKAWGFGMPYQGELDGVVAPGLLAIGELANDLVRQIPAFEQAEQVALLKMRIAR